jgi:hypothetical protein
MWGSVPAMYCEPCAVIKKDSVDVTNQITDLIYLSGMQAAAKFDGKRLCVHEMTPTYEGQFHHIPVLVKKPNSKSDRTGAVASTEALDRAADLIEEHVANGVPLLVHCYGGVERSPLTLAWWLVRSKQYNTLQEAYDFLKAKRPVVSERLFWLP